MKSLLETENLTKRFGALVANNAISLSVRPGDRLAILGENGAGKSTLMRMLAGELQPDAGTIAWRGAPVRWRSARDAQIHGVGIVHQHYLLVGALSVAENVGLGVEPRRGLALDRAALAARVREIGEATGLAVDPHALVRDLTVAAQQKVEILKALYREAQHLILDEPTASLAPQESADLIANLRRLSEQGMTLLFVSHKLPEVLDLCNRIAVLRAGRLVAVMDTEDTSPEELAALLVGEAREARPPMATAPNAPPPAVPEKAPALEVEGLVAPGGDGETGVDGVSFAVHPGEILSIAGVDGNGQAALAGALMGLRPAASGAVRLLGRDITAASTRARYEAGIAFVPEDRQQEGLALDFTLAENVALGSHDRPPYASGIRLNRRAMRHDAAEIIQGFGVRALGPEQRARALSGGNQQKFLFGRELGRKPRVLIVCQPTRGLDMEATRQVRERLRAEADAGCAILLFSLDLDEILALGDRIAVLYRGRVAGEATATEASPERIGRLMLGETGP